MIKHDTLTRPNILAIVMPFIENIRLLIDLKQLFVNLIKPKSALMAKII